MKVLGAGQVDQEGADDDGVRPPGSEEAGAQRLRPGGARQPAAERAAHHRPSAVGVALAGDAERLAQQAGGDDAGDQAEDDQRVAREGEPGRVRHQAAPVGVGDGDKDGDADQVLAEDDQPPEGSVERDGDDRLDEAEAEDAGGPDGDRQEAVEDGQVHQAGPAVAEHAGLAEDIDEEAGCPFDRPIERARGSRQGEDAQVASHGQGEVGRRQDEERRCQRVVRDQLDHG